jgi:large subunit ribosomal protein L4e
MKTKLINKEGKEAEEIILPKFFSNEIREDICQKYFQTLTYIQPHAPYKEAGKRHVASGITSKVRHKFKTGYGHQRARTPRKILWRRGTQFYWIGAEVANTRGGRRAHPPKIEHFLVKKKINKKEKDIAIKSALASTSSTEMIKRRYDRLKEKNVKINFPIVIKDEVLKSKAKDFFKILKNILGDNFEIAVQDKKIRAGKGKTRNRKYKRNAGLLLVIGKNEKFKIKGLEVTRVNELNVKSLWPLGRLTIYTENSIKELKERFEEK